MAKKENKYLYGWNIWTNYGYGWEIECSYDRNESTYAQVRVTSTRTTNPNFAK